MAPKTTKTAAKPAAKKTAAEKPAKAPKPAKAGTTIAQDEALERSLGRPISDVLPINSLITWPLNPRQASPSEADDQAVRELADSIEAQGLLSPILARDTGRESIVEGFNLHEVIAGERRRRALMLLRVEGRLESDLVPVRRVIWDDAQALLAAGAENLARADMHAMDEALLFENLVKAGMQERDIASKLGVGERTVYRRRRLCKLIPDAQSAFRSGKMTKAQAEALAGGEADRQISMLPRLLQSDFAVHYITHVMTGGYPLEKDALFSIKRYRDAGGTTDVVERGEVDVVILTDLDLFKKMQEEAIADQIGSLRESWGWVDRLDQDSHPLHGKDGYSRNVGSISFPGAGALVWVSPDLRTVNIFTDVLKPGHLERWQNAVKEGGEEALAEAREAEEAGETPEPPELPSVAGGAENEREPGDAARLMNASQIEFVRAAQTQALRKAMTDSPREALAWTILVMMGAVSEIQISYAQEAKAPDGDEHLGAAFDYLRPRWPDCPSAKDLEGYMTRWHIWRERPGLAASCFEALIERDIQLIDLLALVAAARIACWHNPYRSDRTSYVSPLNEAVANAVSAHELLPEVWRPEKEFWKGYDAIGLKAVLAQADFDPTGFHGAKKGELLATLADVSPEHTVRIPELQFMTAGVQEDAVIAARAKVLDATSPAAAAAPTADAGGDEEREAA